MALMATEIVTQAAVHANPLETSKENSLYCASVMRRLFKGRGESPLPDDIVEERWESGFGFLSKNRFVPEFSPSYTAEVSGRALRLNLLKKRTFAWVNDPLYRYKDLVIKAECAFAPAVKHGALGFVFRHLNEDSFYYFLVSNTFMYRFDLLLGGNPIVLIPWTPSPQFDTGGFHLRIIAHGGNFSFYVNNRWVGEVDDDSIDAGGIAFAGQNYEESDTASFLLKRIILDSNPINVETQFYRWTRYSEIDSSQRMLLAKTFYNQAQYSPAIVQIKKAAHADKLSGDDLLLMGDCLIRLGLYQEGIGAMEAALAREPGSVPATVGKASCLYGLNRFGELKKFLLESPGIVEGSSVLCDLLGNAEQQLGNTGAAGDWYARAADQEPEMPIYLLNAGLVLFKQDKSRSAEYLGKALRLFFRLGSAEDIQKTILLLEEIVKDIPPESAAPRKMEVDEIRGKLLFQEGRYGEAEKLFARLIELNYPDSSVYYLQGMILQSRNESLQALAYFQKAADLEPEAGIYWFRLAECLFLLDLDCSSEVSKALELATEDVWTLNLAGQVKLAENKFEEALDFFERARAGSGEPAISANYADCLYKLGRVKDALSVLDEAGNHPLILNQKGNLLVLEGRYLDALAVYRKALAEDLTNAGIDARTIRENMADACLGGDLYSEAETALVRLLDEKPTARVYHSLGNLTEIKGEFRRAETIYEEGLRIYPDNAPLLSALGWLKFKRGDHERAGELAEKAKGTEGGRKLFKAVKEATELLIRCDACGREWRTPKAIPPQSQVNLYGDPNDESPAGRCPTCKKVYCVACAKKNVKDNRFVCGDCREPLKLSDDYIKYLVKGYL